MKIKNKKSSPITKLGIPATILVLISGFIFAVAFSFSNIIPPTSGDPEAELPLPESQNDPVPLGPIPTDDTGKEGLGDEETPTPDNKAPVITLTAVSIDSNLLRARALIQGVVSSGNCQLLVTRGGQTIFSESATIQAGPSSSTCRGFDVSLENTANGPLAVSISYQSGSTTSTSQVSEVVWER